MDSRHQLALEAVLAELAADPEVVGVVFTGSIQQGRPAKTSDLDLYVVTHKELTWRTTQIYHGVTAELFVNNVASMHWRITRPDEVAACAGFATGDVLLDRTGEVAELQAIARRRWEAGPPALGDEQVSMLRYALNDLCEDLEDVEHDPVASAVVGGALVNEAMEAYCKLNCLWGDKPKRMVAYLKKRDAALGHLLEKYFLSGHSVRQVMDIVDYVLAPVGGRLATWESKKVKYPGGA